jgi:hypothetical protein
MEPHETVVFRWLAAGDAGELAVFDELLHPDAVVTALVVRRSRSFRILDQVSTSNDLEPARSIRPADVVVAAAA